MAAQAAIVDPLDRIMFTNGVTLETAKTFRVSLRLPSAVRLKRAQKTGATISQPATATLSSPGHTLTSGFWGEAFQFLCCGGYRRHPPIA